jgi:hypothetical protein
LLHPRKYNLHDFEIAALMVENTFTSAPDVLKKIPGVIGHLTFLVTQKWWSAHKVSHMPPTLPILMLSGLQDTVIPSSHMAKLWEVASTRNPPKKRRQGPEPEYILPKKDMFKAFQYGEHSESLFTPLYGCFPSGRASDTTVHQRKYWPTVFQFLDKALDNTPSPSPVE